MIMESGIAESDPTCTWVKELCTYDCGDMFARANITRYNHGPAVISLQTYPRDTQKYASSAQITVQHVRNLIEFLEHVVAVSEPKGNWTCSDSD